MGESHIPINLFHIFAVAPFFLYVAFMRGQLPPWIFQMLIGLGVVILAYHGFKSYLKWKAQSTSLWINLVHVLVVAPVLIFVGVKGYDTPRWGYEVMAMLAFGTLGYHLYSIVLQLQDPSIQNEAKK
jgi:hypothetical protein